MEIKTIEAQLNSTNCQNPLTKAQYNYKNKLHNKLKKLKIDLQATNNKIYNHTYLAELEKYLLNPLTPSKEFKKPPTGPHNPLSEMYIDHNDLPTLSKEQNTVHHQIYKFYKELFAHQDCMNDFPDLEKFIGNIDTKKISPTENSDLEQPFLKPEVASFIKTMSNAKAPGITETTPAFCKVLGIEIVT